MGRFALALAAIVILMLSAGLTRGQPQAAPLQRGRAERRSFSGQHRCFSRRADADEARCDPTHDAALTE